MIFVREAVRIEKMVIPINIQIAENICPWLVFVALSPYPTETQKDEDVYIIITWLGAEGHSASSARVDFIPNEDSSSEYN